MKPLYLALLLAPQLATAQKITTFTDPSTQTRWLMTDVANLDPMLVIADQGICRVNFRVAGDQVNLYLQGRGAAIGPRDFIAFCMDKDTVVVHSTGAQPGGTIPSAENISPLPVHEYAMTADDLRRMARGGDLNQVLVSDFLGMQTVRISGHHDRLSAYATALLQAMGN
ncbi:MAG TPA: hypothetical protein VL547_07355 [Dinghuibacter sp.]|uniref:hypothetical protein n=1 Tax=Dinghuibacter sp. TaxID=2024697 RepID=UPI002BEF8326|nr:hypothetical protein [Dinghuibacter sp.]HTJ11823.1 hypothetical protein [Dinghuibacter sp.]